MFWAVAKRHFTESTPSAMDTLALILNGHVSVTAQFFVHALGAIAFGTVVRFIRFGGAIVIFAKLALHLTVFSVHVGSERISYCNQLD
jgi:hypothetical protein